MSNAQKARLEPFFPKPYGIPHADDRQVLIGIILFNNDDLSCRDAPKEDGPHKTLYNRWKQWSYKGINAQWNVSAVELGQQQLGVGG